MRLTSSGESTHLQPHGISLNKMNARDIQTIIKFESGGNPNAINN